jgi:hypothetical protein
VKKSVEISRLIDEAVASDRKPTPVCCEPDVQEPVESHDNTPVREGRTSEQP